MRWIMTKAMLSARRVLRALEIPADLSDITPTSGHDVTTTELYQAGSSDRSDPYFVRSSEPVPGSGFIFTHIKRREWISNWKRLCVRHVKKIYFQTTANVSSKAFRTEGHER